MAGIYNFPTVKKGDTFKLRRMTITSDGAPLDLTDATVRMILKASPDNKKIVHEFDLYISNNANGEITLRDWDININPYTYHYDLIITLSDGRTKTYLEGNFTVKN